MPHWLLHFLGLDSASGTPYLAWSGILADAGELAIIGGLVSIYRRHVCEVHGCWRIGRHTTAAGHHTCRRHHPDDHLTHAGVTEAHEAAEAAKEAHGDHRRL